MNPELSNRLTKYLDEIERAMQAGGDFVAEQTPLLVQEFLAWTFWQAAFLVVVLSILVTVCVVMWPRIWRRRLEYGVYSNERMACDAALFLSALLGTVLLLPISINAHKMVKVSVAPRVVLLEEAGKILGRK